MQLPWTPTESSPTEPVVVQVSRLELRRRRDVPGFLVVALQIRRDVLASPGCHGVSLIAEPGRRTFWTLSAWRGEDDIRAFMRSERHRSVMVRYRDKMAGSHFTTWFTAGPDELPPTWNDARQRLISSCP